MENIIEIDEEIVGLKKDILKFLKSELKRQVAEQEDSEELCSTLDEFKFIIESIENECNDYSLIKIRPDCMQSGWTWNYCTIDNADLTTADKVYNFINDTFDDIGIIAFGKEIIELAMNRLVFERDNENVNTNYLKLQNIASELQTIIENFEI